MELATFPTAVTTISGIWILFVRAHFCHYWRYFLTAAALSDIGGNFLEPLLISLREGHWRYFLTAATTK